MPRYIFSWRSGSRVETKGPQSRQIKPNFQFQKTLLGNLIENTRKGRPAELIQALRYQNLAELQVTGPPPQSRIASRRVPQVRWHDASQHVTTQFSSQILIQLWLSLCSCMPWYGDPFWARGVGPKNILHMQYICIKVRISDWYCSQRVLSWAATSPQCCHRGIPQIKGSS